jgi:ankyrin repeat protein
MEEKEVSEVRQALYRGDRERAGELVEGGAALNVFDAAAFGDVDLLESLLSANPALAGEWSADGFTALHFAAYLGGYQVVEVLLAAGADVHAAARNGMQVQPLHSGAALGDVEACRLLLAAGADANAKQHGGWTPLDEALITKNESLAALLRDHGGRISGNALPGADPRTSERSS